MEQNNCEVIALCYIRNGAFEVGFVVSTHQL